MSQEEFVKKVRQIKYKYDLYKRGKLILYDPQKHCGFSNKVSYGNQFPKKAINLKKYVQQKRLVCIGSGIGALHIL